MANEISASCSFSVTKGLLSENRSFSGVFSLDAAAPAKAAGIIDVDYSAHQAIDMGDVAEAGWALFKNLDADNFIQLGVDDSGTFIPFVKLLPGQFALCRLATSAPYAKADTAAARLSYDIYDA